MTTITSPSGIWYIIDLPAGDPQEPENRELVKRLFDLAYEDWLR